MRLTGTEVTADPVAAVSATCIGLRIRYTAIGALAQTRASACEPGPCGRQGLRRDICRAIVPARLRRRADVSFAVRVHRQSTVIALLRRILQRQRDALAG